jgi:deazaflavin-dependent oxidoreductase (nitroreductase family)
MGRNKPHYPTRAEFEAGARPVEAVPTSFALGMMTGALGHRLDRWCVRRLGFSFISWQAARDRGISYQPSLLLTTIGRKTGAKRPVVLPYVPDGEQLVVVASNAGGAKAPAWVGNLIANPYCMVVVKRRMHDMRAYVAEGGERERLIDVVAKHRPHVFNYDQHARRKGRRLDLVVLEPARAR